MPVPQSPPHPALRATFPPRGRVSRRRRYGRQLQFTEIIRRLADSDFRLDQVAIEPGRQTVAVDLERRLPTSVGLVKRSLHRGHHGQVVAHKGPRRPSVSAVASELSRTA